MKLVIAGGRDFSDYELLKEKVSVVIADQSDVEIVSGGARGADSLGERYAREHGLNVRYFPANWDLHGKSAGFIRNREMAIYADTVICFWDGISKGTSHMINLAKSEGKQLIVVKY